MIVYSVFDWSLEASSLNAVGNSLGRLPSQNSTYWNTLAEQLRIGFATPWPTLLFIASLVIYVYFVDELYRPVRRYVIGLVHGFLHTAVVIGIGSISFWLARQAGLQCILWTDIP